MALTGAVTEFLIRPQKDTEGGLHSALGSGWPPALPTMPAVGSAFPDGGGSRGGAPSWGPWLSERLSMPTAVSGSPDEPLSLVSLPAAYPHSSLLTCPGSSEALGHS